MDTAKITYGRMRKTVKVVVISGSISIVTNMDSATGVDSWKE
jgi:hypothetical protein